jgi:hypothetical protein
MKHGLSLVIVLGVISILGCAGTPTQEVAPQTEQTEANRYLTAEATGSTEGEAKRAAMAELAAVFQARVRAETLSRAQAYTHSQDSDAFEKQVEQTIRIETDVRLEGAHIGWVRHDVDNGGFRAQARLDRNQAADRWRNDLIRIQSQIDAGLQGLSAVDGRLSRLVALNRLSGFITQMAVLESRLSVIGRPSMPFDQDLTTVLAERETLRNTVALYLEIKGEEADTFAHRLGTLITAQGYHLVESLSEAGGLVSGNVRIQPMALRNTNAQFVRALADVSLVDLDTRKELAAVGENVRKGHMDVNEARRRAVDQLARLTATRLFQSFGEMGIEPGR